jgi:polysaccharide export outer membrane protein
MMPIWKKWPYFQSDLAGAWLLFVGITCLMLAAGCSMNPAYPPAPRVTPSADYDYKIGPLDTVNIIVWRNPELSMTVPVRPDGKISTPLVEDLSALDKTPAQLSRDIEKALGKYIRDPVVTVVVTTFVGPTNEQIRVIGEATKPQVLAFRRKMTLLDVMIAVGGLTDFADGNGASIFRVSEGGKLYSVRLRDLVKRGDITANVDMSPGDILIIPQGYF